MVSSAAPTVAAYLAALPPERREALQKVRAVIRKNLAKGFAEGMQYGMIGYYVPLSRYPETYNGQALTIAALAAQKSYFAVYLMSVYGHPATRRWFEKAYRESGKRLDMGKSCVRFRKVDDLPLDVVGEAVRRVSVDGYIAAYEASLRGARHAAKGAGRGASKTGKTSKTSKPAKATRPAAARKKSSVRPRPRA
jgi:hypothetical protein